MNLLEGTLIEREGTVARFRVIDQEVSLSLAPETVKALPDVADGGTVTLGIRPRAYKLAPGEGPDTFSAVIDIVEPMGAEILVRMLESGVDVRVVVPRGTPLELGERVHMRCKPGQAHIFNADRELVRA